MNHLLSHLSQFFTKRLKRDSPLLLALSGGPDSLALLYLLLEYQTIAPLKLAIAHVDHRWRPESAQEAKQLQALAQKLALPFHLKELDPTTFKGNMEEFCREERIHFFANLCKEKGYQAVLLAHHANDQAETVLKRVLEGAALTSLTGLQEETIMENTLFWRPLLKCQKEEILTWLKEKELKPFEDTTNYDPKFLRGRLRTEIIPYLNGLFGKDIQNNLCHLAKETEALQRYFRRKLDQLPLEVNPEGPKILLNLQSSAPDPYELKMSLRELLRRHHIVISRQQLETTTELLLTDASDKQLKTKTHILFIDRRRLFISPQYKQPPETQVKLSPFDQKISWGEWEITIEKRSSPQKTKSGWQNVWKGKMELSLPEGEYHIGITTNEEETKKALQKIGEKWTHEKVPTFLRKTTPLIWQNNTIFHEFLSSKETLPNDIPSISQWLHCTFHQKVCPSELPPKGVIFS